MYGDVVYRGWRLGLGPFLRYHLATMVSASIGVLLLGATMGIHRECEEYRRKNWARS